MDIQIAEVGKIPTLLKTAEQPTANVATMNLLLKEIFYVRFLFW